jgi:LAS superfamily LD-carboxypeptidase LdcB
LVAYDPFPADMGAWTCGTYLQALDDSAYQPTLEQMLQIRPHRFYEPADPRELAEIDGWMVSKTRKERPVYHHALHPDVLDTLAELLRTADQAGLSLRVQSAYRSPSYQNMLWKLAVRRYGSDLSHAAFAVAPPCFSEHATGRAVDFHVDGSELEFSDTPEYQWLQENAGQWGWRQSFRADNGAVLSPQQQGIMIEPWHFRHVSIDGSGLLSVKPE